MRVRGANPYPRSRGPPSAVTSLFSVGHLRMCAPSIPILSLSYSFSCILFDFVFLRISVGCCAEIVRAKVFLNISHTSSHSLFREAFGLLCIFLASSLFFVRKNNASVVVLPFAIPGPPVVPPPRLPPSPAPLLYLYHRLYRPLLSLAPRVCWMYICDTNDGVATMIQLSFQFKLVATLWVAQLCWYFYVF